MVPLWLELVTTRTVAAIRVAGVTEPFDPPGAEWRRVSPKLGTIRLITLAATTGFVAIVGVVLGVQVTWWAGAPIVFGAIVAAACGMSVIVRQVRAWGYDLGADALTVRHGVMFRELVVVPYARMQYVDVQAGPLERRFGIATVRLHTASAATDARIPGLGAGDAAELRDELARLGETRSVGL